MQRPFHNRTESGKLLATYLTLYRREPGVLVLALPRGGVPVAFEVAQALHAPLDLFLVRKLGVPGQEELAMGALATGGIRVLNNEVVASCQISAEVIEAVTAREQKEIERQESFYRGTMPPILVAGKTLILVDDGLATGSTMRAAIAALRQRQPARIVIAVPVAAASTCEQLRLEVDDVIGAVTPASFLAVGLHYEDFSQTTDDEVRDLLLRSRAWTDPAASPPVDRLG